MTMFRHDHGMIMERSCHAMAAMFFQPGTILKHASTVYNNKHEQVLRHQKFRLTKCLGTVR